MSAGALATLLGVARRRWWLLAALIVLGCAAAVAGRHLWAWHHLRAGRDALERYHTQEARAHLAKCLRVWPDSPEAHFLSARAARRAGDFEAAAEHLHECQRLERLAQKPTDDSVLEWALLQAATGDLREVEEFLHDRANRDAAVAPLIWEALVEGYLRMCRVLDALSCLERWLDRQPDSVIALSLRGHAWRQVGSGDKAGTAYERVVELDPAQDEARRQLVHCQVRGGRFAEAEGHLRHLLQQRPGDPDLLVYVARCQQGQNQRDEARQTLDAILADHPSHGAALFERGRMALAAKQAEEAEHFLARAVQATPYDYPANWNYYQALQLRGKATEAQGQKERAQQLKDHLERRADLRQRQLSARPYDPALHCEMGTLLLALGEPDVGERWLLSALHLNERYQPAHAALADHYERQGDTEKAAYHRAQAQTLPPPSAPTTAP